MSSFFLSSRNHQLHQQPYYPRQASTASPSNTSYSATRQRNNHRQHQNHNQHITVYPPPVVMENSTEYQQQQEELFAEEFATKAQITADHIPMKRLDFLISQIEDKSLANMVQHELQLLNLEQQRLVSTLEQRIEIVSNENEELKAIINESQKRYEKAVREMQFFKKKYDKSIAIHQQQQQLPPPPPTPPATSSCSSTTASTSHITNETLLNWPASPTSLITASTATDTTVATPRRRQNSNTTGSIFSAFSSSTVDSASEIIPNVITSSVSSASTTTSSRRKPILAHGSSRNNSMLSSYSTPSSSAGYSHNGATNSSASSVYSSTTSQLPYAQTLPTTIAPSIRSIQTTHTTATSTTTYANNTSNSSMIQQRRTDPLVFGGSDALWDTISKGQGSDATVEKIISNFLRRGGSPNTAKQSPTANAYPAVKYGYGMIHALIVTKAPVSLELLLQQGANPDVVSLGQTEEDKVSPCYLAASVGWLTGLQKLIAFGADLISARGAGSQKKTALHIAAEQGHAAVTEYIVNMTQGVLNLETDNLGATVLHYACVSGHVELVSFAINVCAVPLDQTDNRGEAPLHWATRHGRLEVVMLLVEKYGCDVNAYTPSALKTNSSSKKSNNTATGTPYDIAKANGHKKLAEYIKTNGGLTTKKMEKRREEEMSQKIPIYLQSALARNGLMSDF